MKFTTTVSSSTPIDQLIKELPERLDAIASHLGRKIAQRALDEVKGRIPASAAWAQTYRAAVQAFESSDGKRFAVAGYAAIQSPAAPSETTLLEFDNSTPIAKVMNPYNPWVIDAMPALKGDYDGNIVIRAASASEVESERRRLLGVIDVVRAALISPAPLGAGATLAPGPAGSRIYIKGSVYTDVVWLAKRLETGAGGFPKKPHWAPASVIVAKRGESWGKSEADRIEELLRGGASSKLPEATANQLSAFAQKRAEAGA